MLFKLLNYFLNSNQYKAKNQHNQRIGSDKDKKKEKTFSAWKYFYSHKYVM